MGLCMLVASRWRGVVRLVRGRGEGGSGHSVLKVAR